MMYADTSFPEVYEVRYTASPHLALLDDVSQHEDLVNTSAAWMKPSLLFIKQAVHRIEPLQNYL